MIKLIAITDLAFGISKNGGIPWSFHEDRHFFKQQTIGSVIIMGRLTYESLGCKALPLRMNCVISTTLKNPDVNIEVFSSLEAAIEKYNDAWIIGGAEIYNYALSNGYVDYALLTIVHKRYNADKFLMIEYLPDHYNILHSADKYDVREYILTYRNA